jgi:UDP-N-acetylglucosamine 2-epimerase (non-hydrolysing)
VVQERGWSRGGYYVATIHRAENTDRLERLELILEALSGLDKPVLLLAHPRLTAKAGSANTALSQGAIEAVAPLPYPELIAAVKNSAGVITDSGGLQKEAFLLRVPCTTVRTETEWVETVDLGWNVLANTVEQVRDAVLRPHPEATEATPYGDGRTAVRVVDALRGRLRPQ